MHQPSPTSRHRLGALLIGAGALLTFGLTGCSDDPAVEPRGSALFQDAPTLESPTPPPRATTLLQSASVRCTELVVVRAGADTTAERLGTMAGETRVKGLEFRTGPGCNDGWVRIDEHGWVCSTWLEPDGRPPAGVELPVLEPGKIVPGEYGDVIVNGAALYTNAKQILKGTPVHRIYGHTVVTKREEVEIGGKRYWRTGTGEYISARDVRPYKPSTFHGVHLQAGVTLPLVFVMPGARADQPGLKAASLVDLAAGRAYAPVLERVQAGKLRPGQALPFRYRVGEKEWVSGPLVRYAEQVPRPADVGPTERWLDINLDEQVLVAYEGDTPVYTTLVSTGRNDPTPRGLFRVYLKQSETDMASETGDDRPYMVEKVPWTQFFQAGIALHGAYWHNGFGYPRSRGCVNLAPVDARFLFQWTDPQPQPGWSSAHGMLQLPGTLVQVRRNGGEKLYYYGYAREVARARGVKVPSSPKLSDQMAEARSEIARRNAEYKARLAEQAAKKEAEARAGEAGAPESAPAVPPLSPPATPAPARTEAGGALAPEPATIQPKSPTTPSRVEASRDKSDI